MRIKLENIMVKSKDHKHPVTSPFCPVCGEKVIEEATTEEYICAACRHLVGLSEKYCGFCGAELGEVMETEHWVDGKKIGNTEYKKALKRVK